MRIKLMMIDEERKKTINYHCLLCKNGDFFHQLSHHLGFGFGFGVEDRRLTRFPQSTW